MQFYSIFIVRRCGVVSALPPTQRSRPQPLIERYVPSWTSTERRGSDRGDAERGTAPLLPIFQSARALSLLRIHRKALLRPRRRFRRIRLFPFDDAATSRRTTWRRKRGRVLSVARCLPNGAADRPDAYMYDHDPGRCSALVVIDGRSVRAPPDASAVVVVSFVAPPAAVTTPRTVAEADTVVRVLSLPLRRTLLIPRSSVWSNISPRAGIVFPW